MTAAVEESTWEEAYRNSEERIGLRCDTRGRVGIRLLDTMSRPSTSLRFVVRLGVWALFALAFAARLWLGTRQLQAIGWAHYDDRWFLERAIDIMQGHWLGDYNDRTLMKGPVYPLWVAFVASQRIPLLFAQQLLYALASLAATIAFAPVVRSSWLRLLLFLLLLFNPMSYSDDLANRVTRDGIYSALALFVIAGVAGGLLRLDAPRRPLPWSLLAAVSLALFWNTREEGVWIVPFLVFAALALLLWMLREAKERWRKALVVFALPIAVFFATHFAVVLVNGMQYDTFAVVEMKEKSFLRAYGSLTHVRQHPSRPRIPVPKEVRMRVYAVSPAFAELRPYFEGTLGESWKRGGDDLPGESFMWAFRQAVAEAGYYRRGAAAVRGYYDRVSREIDAARRAGRLDARPARATLVPPLLKGQRRAIVSGWVSGLIRTPRFLDAWVTPRFSSGDERELREFAETTRSPLAPRQRRFGTVRIIGWAVHVNGYLDLAVEHTNGRSVPGARVTRLPSPDLYEHLKSTWKEFPPALHSRFDIEAPAADTSLVLSLRGTVVDRVPLDSFPPIVDDPNVRMVIDRIDFREAPSQNAPDIPHGRVLRRITRSYQWFLPTLLILALLLYWPNVRWLARWRGEWTLPLLIAGLIAAVAARVFILAMIDVTSFPVFISGYVAPSYPLLLVFTMMSAFEGVTAVRNRLRPVPPPTDATPEVMD